MSAEFVAYCVLVIAASAVSSYGAAQGVRWLWARRPWAKRKLALTMDGWADQLEAMRRPLPFITLDVSGEDEDREPAAPQPALPPGRQRVAMPRTLDQGGLFGLASPKAWAPPVPTGARHAMWEDLHRFAPGAKPTRDPHYGLMNHEPPLALICPACDLEQTPLTSGERGCPYCGLRMKLHGSRVFWWRSHQPEVPEWKP